MEKREFTELLKGCTPVKDVNGNILVQSILNMELVCLTTDEEYSMDDKFGNPMNLIASNTGYGHLNFRNTDAKPTITPTQMAVINDQSAQNHGMVKAGYVRAKSSTDFNDAGCVQGSQTGYLHEVTADNFRMLPVTMREMVFEQVGDHSYDHIYPAINRLGRDTNSSTGNYLDVYFNKYDKDLEQFIAHFERPRNLIGTIVLVDGEIVAIDKFPSYTYAEQVWDLMIRDCYGALALISQLNSRTGRKTFTEILNDLDVRANESTTDRLARALELTKKSITERVTEKLEAVLDLEFDAELDIDGNPSRQNGPRSYVLTNEGYIGQVISESNFHYMVSIVKKESFDPNALRRVNEMKRKARSQDRFGL